jgi:hypothetical protein
MYYRQIITERRLPFQPSAAQTYGNQLLDLIQQKGIPNVTLPADENGHAYIDKEKHPDLYDWAVNGKSEAIQSKYFKINDCQQVGLNHESYIDTSATVTLPQSSVEHLLGTLTETDIRRLLDFLAR